MNELLDLTIRFDNGDGFTEAEAVRFAALLLITGLVHSVGRYGRFVHDLIEAGLVDDIRADIDMLEADPLAVLGVN